MNHWFMPIEVRAVPREEFNAWAEQAKTRFAQGLPPAPPPSAARRAPPRPPSADATRRRGAPLRRRPQPEISGKIPMDTAAHSHTPMTTTTTTSPAS